MRIGHGFDAHRFAEGRQLVLGGVAIPHSQGLAAHSDGDVVIHALCDALLGAAALGDMGRHFPDTDADLTGVDSRILLRRVVELLAAQDYHVSNVDITVVLELPRMAPHIDSIRDTLSSDLGVAKDSVGVKATTTETMGFTGRQEGIAAWAVVLIE